MTHDLPDTVPLRAHMRMEIRHGGHGLQNDGLALIQDLEAFHDEDHETDPGQEVLTHG